MDDEYATLPFGENDSILAAGRHYNSHSKQSYIHAFEFAQTLLCHLVWNSFVYYNSCEVDNAQLEYSSN